MTVAKPLSEGTSGMATESFPVQSPSTDFGVVDPGLPLNFDLERIRTYWSLRPAVTMSRIFEVATKVGPWLLSILLDIRLNRKRSPRKRAAQLRNILTDLGPTAIKLGQALSVRPDIVGPQAMEELQLLCDAVPSFSNEIAFRTIEQELGQPVEQLFSDITPETKPIAAASLGQVYKVRLRATGEIVAVKVQRPDMLRAVSLDLYIARRFAEVLQWARWKFTDNRSDYVGLLTEWSKGAYKELDYINEAANSKKFKKMMMEGVPEVYVPKVYDDYTSRKVLTTEWITGTKLSESDADDIKKLVGVGVESFLYQLLKVGFMQADPHRGNLLRSQDGRLCIIDFGLMTSVEKAQADGMVAAIIHLANRDYKNIVDDMIFLDFLPKTIDKSKVLPVLAAVLDQALQGGGAKAINFQSLSSDLAGVTFDFPFKIPPYFALIIRALGVLEGIALTGDPKFKLIMESFPFVTRLILTDDSPMLRESLRQILYKDGTFSPTRLKVLLDSSQGVLSEGKAFVDFDTPSSANSSATSSAINFLFSDKGTVLRDIISDEIANGLDVWIRQSYNRLSSFFTISLPAPVQAFTSSPASQQPLFAQFSLLPQENFALPPVSEADERYLENIKELVQFLINRENNGIDNEGLLRLMPEIMGKSSILGKMVVGKMNEKLTKRFFQDFLRGNGEVVGNKRRVSLPWARQ